MSLNPRQFEQLPMFMSAREIKANYAPLEADRGEVWAGHSKITGDRFRKETDDELWSRKANEFWDDGHAHDAMEHGIRNPVHLGHSASDLGGKPQIVGGHHRIAFMGEQSPDELMPVLHHTGIHGARDMAFEHQRTGKGFRYT